MIAGHLQEKYGFFYIVLSYRDENGKRHTPWFPTKLPVKGNKKRAEALLLEMRQTYQPPELAGKTAAQEQAQPELMFTDFLQQWLEVAKSTIQLTTYASYAGMMRSAILPYFLERNIRLKQLTAKDIQDFYSFQLQRVSANTVIHYHAVIHRALRYAVKMDLLQANPADKIERPRKEKFVGKFYDRTEVSRLFSLLEGHPLEIPIKLGAFYGLRRSEILGLRWSAIDFRADTLTIQHTVTACKRGWKTPGGCVGYHQDQVQYAYAAPGRQLPGAPAEKAAGTGSLPQALRALLLHQIPGLHLRQ